MRACPRTFGLHVLSRKWSYYALRALVKPKRFNELKGELRFATNHVLSRELHMLAEEHLISHADGVYALTSGGQTLLDAAEPLYKWGSECLFLGECPQEQQCSHCARYEENVRSRAYG